MASLIQHSPGRNRRLSSWPVRCAILLGLAAFSVHAQEDSAAAPAEAKEAVAGSSPSGAGDVVELRSVQVKAARSENFAKAALEGTVVDLRARRSAPADLKSTLQTASGIHLRQNGGSGSDFNLNLNGLQGKAVRVFVDGIPLDSRSAELALTNLSVEDLDRIEVYKGVLPSELGADALGGGINLITRRITRDAAEGSVQVGSFGERKVHGRVYKELGDHGFARVDAGAATADNDYEMEVLATDPVTRKQVLKRVRRFHDGYETLNADARAGVRDHAIIGDLEAGIRWNGMHKEYQHGASASLPFGEVEGRVTEVAPRLDWNRQWGEGLKTGLRAEYILNHAAITDTGTRRYNWDGTFEESDRDGGEIDASRKTKARLDTRILSTRARLRYDLDSARGVIFNYVRLGLERRGEDPYGEKLLESGVDPLTIPTTYERHYATLGLEGRFAETWGYEVMAKGYAYSLRGPTSSYGYWDGSYTREQDVFGGAGGAVKWRPDASWTLRLAYERAIRFPDQDEVLGDGFFVLPNYLLKPERSHNLNLGTAWTNGRADAGRLAAELNAFARLQDDIIVQRGQGLVFTAYQNDSRARSTGLEAGGLWRPWTGGQAEANATYQSLRKMSAKDKSEEYLLESRLPNIPYFFANLAVGQRFRSAAVDGDELELTWSARYVHEFLLYAIPKENEGAFFWQKPDVDTEFLIPSQFLHNLGVTYHAPGRVLSLGLEARNIFDEAAYDNFRVPRPGRSFHAKITARY